MRNKPVIVGVLLGLVLLAVVLAAVWRSSMPANAPAPQAMPVPPARTSVAPASAAVSGGAAVAPAPWLVAPNSAPAGAAATAAAKPGMEQIQKRLSALTANGRTPTPHEVDEVLAELQRVQGGNNVGGVDLGALRENLARAEEIQRLAKEMEKLAQNPSKQDLPRIQSLMTQIQQLQSGIRADVSVKPAGGTK